MLPLKWIFILFVASAIAIYICVAFGATSVSHASGMGSGAHDAVSAAADEHIDVMQPPGYIDCVPVTQHMRILLMSQRRQKDNGIYVMSLRGLVRDKDHARPKLVRGNRMVYVHRGDKYGGMVMMSKILKVYDASYAPPDLYDNWPPVVFLPLDVGQHKAMQTMSLSDVERADDGWHKNQK